MQKSQNKIIAKNVGANCVHLNSRGITLIALIITIIVMIILVAVTVRVVLNGGLFTTAQNASEETLLESDREILQAAVVAAMDDNLQVSGKRIKNNLSEDWQVDGIYGGSNIFATSPNENFFEIYSDGTIKTEGEDLEFLRKYFLGENYEGKNLLNMIQFGDRGSIEGFIDDPSTNINENTEITILGSYEEDDNVGCFEIEYNYKKYILKCNADLENQTYLTTSVELVEQEFIIWEQAERPAEWDNDKIIAVTDGTNIVPLPEGYEISSTRGEDTIENGLVVKDSYGNEFVWIPITEDFVNSYNYSSNYSEPKEITTIYSKSGEPYDSQGTLDYLYGEGYYNYEEDFAYNAHYAEMVESVNKYNGFYIGRYETTINDDGNIGSKYNTEVLTSNKILKEGTNSATQEPYYYRWWGLYNAQRNSNAAGNNDYIQTNMIWGQQWDAMVDYFESTNISSPSSGLPTQRSVLKSGQQVYSNNNKDITGNVYDLRNNAYDWTAENYYNTSTSDWRVTRGGYYGYNNNLTIRSTNYPSYSDTHPNSESDHVASRLTLYIK